MGKKWMLVLFVILLVSTPLQTIQSVCAENSQTPNVDSIDVTGSGAVKTITWTVSTSETDDEYRSNVYLSYDNGTLWWLIAENLTSNIHYWDTTGYGIAIWMVKVRVYDLTHPSSLSEVVSRPFDAGTLCETPSFPGMNVSIFSHQTSLNYTEGATGNTISWIKRTSFFGSFPDYSEAVYYIYRNGTLVKQGSIVDGGISINVDGFSPGLYNYTLTVIHKEHSASDTIFVRVHSLAEPISSLFFMAIISIAITLTVILIAVKRR